MLRGPAHLPLYGEGRQPHLLQGNQPPDTHAQRDRERECVCGWVSWRCTVCWSGTAAASSAACSARTASTSSATGTYLTLIGPLFEPHASLRSCLQQGRADLVLGHPHRPPRDTHGRPTQSHLPAALVTLHTHTHTHRHTHTQTQTHTHTDTDTQTQWLFSLLPAGSTSSAGR